MVEFIRRRPSTTGRRDDMALNNISYELNGDGSHTLGYFSDIWVSAFDKRYVNDECLRDLNAHTFAFRLYCAEETFEEYENYFFEMNALLRDSLISVSKLESHPHVHFSSSHFRDDKWGSFSLHGIILVHPNAIEHFWSAAALVTERYRKLTFAKPDGWSDDLLGQWREFENGVLRSRNEVYDGNAQGIVMSFGPEVKFAAPLGCDTASLH